LGRRWRCTVGQFEADIVVEQAVILELKVVSTISASHIAQAHHYLAATGLRLAIIMNFGAESLQTKRIAK
jgi:GxxExxY protein